MWLTGRWRELARRLRQEMRALYLACRDPRVPWYAKAFAAALVAYSLSPIDLIPDFIPILGFVDELILLPLGVLAVRAMIPRDVMDECRRQALEELDGTRPRSRAGLAIVIGFWLGMAVTALWLAWFFLSGRVE